MLDFDLIWNVFFVDKELREDIIKKAAYKSSKFIVGMYASLCICVPKLPQGEIDAYNRKP